MYFQPEPDYNSAVGLLQHLSMNDLNQLLDESNKAKVEELVKDTPQIKSMAVEKEMLLASNKSLAEFNLSREPRLRQARGRLAGAYDSVANVIKEVEAKKQELSKLTQKTSLDTTLAILQTSAAEAEEKTEVIVEDFLSGKTDVETFLETFIPQRKTAHLQKFKADKMADIINKQKPNRFLRTAPPLPPR